MLPTLFATVIEQDYSNSFFQALPSDPKPWYRTKHLLHLNLILLVPLFSSASVGFDGRVTSRRFVGQ